MRAPAFWAEGHDVLPALLSPLAALYDAAGQVRRVLANPVRAPVPVVCVGNLTAGGAGKTPTAIAVARFLTERSRRPHVLTRGYGGRLRGPVRVDPDHGPREVGDEAPLLARAAPTWVGGDRVASAEAAVAAGAGVLVMDDGFQNPHLVKDLSLLVVDGGFGLGNGRVMPAGPLREDAARALARAQAVVYVVDPGREAAGPPPAGIERVPVHVARLEPAPASLALAGRAVVAFAGIGRPQKMFNTLRSLGAEIVGTHAFPDHHVYAPEEIMALIEDAVARGAVAVTTEKDAVRLPPEARQMVEVLRVSLVFDDARALETMLAPVLDG